MTVGRNDPCPCGSGKKYKKCCLHKENVIQLAEHRVEQFYQQKHALVKKLMSFVTEQLPYNQYQQLKTQFKKRIGKHFSEDSADEYFHYWVYMFYRFENGLRGIEWFYQENEHRLTGEEKAITKRWATLKPRLLEAINRNEEGFLLGTCFQMNNSMFQ